jgi:hypothetical protein
MPRSAFNGVGPQPRLIVGGHIKSPSRRPIAEVRMARAEQLRVDLQSALLLPNHLTGLHSKNKWSPLPWLTLTWMRGCVARTRALGGHPSPGHVFKR